MWDAEQRGQGMQAAASPMGPPCHVQDPRSLRSGTEYWYLVASGDIQQQLKDVFGSSAHTIQVLHNVTLQDVQVTGSPGQIRIQHSTGSTGVVSLVGLTPEQARTWCTQHSSTAVRTGARHGNLAAHAAQLPSPQDPRLLRAKGYPYQRPAGSYVYVNGRTYMLPPDSAFPTFAGAQAARSMLGWSVTDEDGSTSRLSDAVQRQGLRLRNIQNSGYTPVLAIGSNASPDQLRRKFPPTEFHTAFVPVFECVLEGFDVVYSPLISSYGSCTATLMPSPGTAVSVFLSYLTDPLLEKMTRTEGAYNLISVNAELLEGKGLEQYPQQRSHISREDNGAAQRLVQCYVHKSGYLSIPFKGAGPLPIAVAEVPAIHRSSMALCQEDMLKAVRAATAVGRDGTAPRQLVYQDPPTPLNEIEQPEFEAGSSRVTGVPWTMTSGLDIWILENIDNVMMRRELNCQLRAASVQPSGDHTPC